MKHICLIATDLTDYQILKPLGTALYKDPGISLTQITSDEHRDSDMVIRHFRVEEDGFTAADESCTFLKGNREYYHSDSLFFKDCLEKFLQTMPPDMAVVIGNSSKTLQAAITASLNNIPVAHIQGGESGYGLWDESYGYGITKLAHLHFTAAENFRQQIIAFGENEETVLNVGSLLVERVNAFFRPKRQEFNTRIGLSPGSRFILIDLHPDAQLGSKNEQMLAHILSDLQSIKLDGRKIVIRTPKQTGIGKMMGRMIREFAANNPGRVVACPLQDIADVAVALAHCDMIISNHPGSLVLAASEKKPAVHVTRKGRNRIRTWNQIEIETGRSALVPAVQKALSKNFTDELGLMISPYEQSNVAQKIKERICSFDSAQIKAKSIYPAEEPGFRVT